MQIKIIKDHDYRHAPGVVQEFRAGRTVDVPTAVAEELIKVGAAESKKAATAAKKETPSKEK